MFSPTMTIGRTQGESKTALKQRIWVFRFIDRGTPAIVLTAYYEQERETVRHKWKNKRQYDVYEKRYATMDWIDVELPDEVAQDAKQVFLEQLADIPVLRDF